MTSRVVRTKLVSYLSRGIAWTTLSALVVAACANGDEDATSAVFQAAGSDGSGSGSGGGSGSGDPTAQQCPPKQATLPTTASCLTADKILFNVTLLGSAGTATGDYPIGIGQENQPPPDAYRADVCERAWVDCVNGHLLPQEATFCSQTCGGACASPSAPFPMGMTPSTTYTVVPCGSIQCWHITCQAYACAAQDGCCATFAGSGA